VDERRNRRLPLPLYPRENPGRSDQKSEPTPSGSTALHALSHLRIPINGCSTCRAASASALRSLAADIPTRARCPKWRQHRKCRRTPIGFQFAAAREAVVRKARMRSASTPVLIVGTVTSPRALFRASDLMWKGGRGGWLALGPAPPHLTAETGSELLLYDLWHNSGRRGVA
jgi:hypothetical protein